MQFVKFETEQIQDSDINFQNFPFQALEKWGNIPELSKHVPAGVGTMTGIVSKQCMYRQTLSTADRV